MVTGDRWVFRECQLVHTVGLHYNTSTPPSANHHSEEVPGLFGAIIRTAGAWAAARLRGGWERARLRQTQEGLLHLLSCRPTHPHPSSFVSPQFSRTLSAESSRRDSWPVLPGRKEDEGVFMSVCIELGGGRPSSNDITDAFKHMHTYTHTVLILLIGCSALVSSFFYLNRLPLF